MSDNKAKTDIRAAAEEIDALQRHGPNDIWASLERRIQEENFKRFGAYEVAVINALPHEFAAIQVLFGPLKKMVSSDGSTSLDVATVSKDTGKELRIIVAGVAGQGLTGAAIAAAQCKSKLPYLKTLLLVGIAAGQPAVEDPERDIWLGDIVVSRNVVQYDHVSRTAEGTVCRGDKLPTPSPALVSIAEALRAEMELRKKSDPATDLWSWEKVIDEGVAGLHGSERPKVDADPHFKDRKYPHQDGYRKGDSRPHLHVGIIGSANTLLRDAAYRDELWKAHKTIAYEMEGAGVAVAAQALSLQYLIVRGICDYADADKNNDWQRYSSLAAAAVTRLILEKV